jgi:hypothetical protein
MKLTRKMDTAESRQYWALIDKAAKEVEDWPDWKKGGIQEPQGHESEKTLAASTSKRSR